MQQGDQYSIMVSIMSGCDFVTDKDVAGVKIRIGDVTKEYPGELSYDSKSRTWLFPITQAQTNSMKGRAAAQVQVNFGGDPAQIIGSKVRDIFIDNSIIKEPWDE